MFHRYALRAFKLLVGCSLLLVPACGPGSRGSLSIPKNNPSGGGGPTITPSPLDVLTFHNDTSRTGQYLSETALSATSVSPATFGKLWTYPVDGQVYAQPLYKYQVPIPGLGVVNVVYVVTMHDSVYAFDADSSALLWQVSLIPPGATTVPLGGFSGTGPSDFPTYTDIRIEIGILSTPVIDPVSGTLYVVSRTKEPGAVGALSTTTNPLGHVFRLHALDLTTGAEKFGGPVQLGGTVLGTGDTNVAGVITFDPTLQLNRCGLLLANGSVYLTFGSIGDMGLWHGWMMVYNATTLAQEVVWCTTPNNPAANPGEAGIWMAGSGPSFDGTSIYFTTGNGFFDTTAPVTDYGDSMVKLAVTGGMNGITPYVTVLDYFTPSNQATLAANDLDLDCGGVLLLPTQPGTVPNLIITAGKNGTAYLVNRDNMGKFNSVTDQIVEEAQGLFPGMSAVPAYWNGTIYWKGATTDIQLPAVNTPLYAFPLIPGTATTPTTVNFAVPSSVSTVTWSWPGSTPSVSANGNTAGTGIVWVVQQNFAFVGGHPVSTAAILRGYDARNLAVELYDSTQNVADGLGTAIKFVVPTIANGRVYMGANALIPTAALPAEVSVFGLK